MSALPPRGTQSGFSLIELLMTMVVAAILLVIALPSFNDAIERNRLTAQTNEFIAAANLARAEAIRRNLTAGLCSSADASVCGGGWDDGWIVWVDLNRDGDSDAGEMIRAGSFSEREEATSDVTDVRFNQRGLRSLPAAGVVEISLKTVGCTTGEAGKAREFSISRTGSISSTKPAC